jgi:hypothetical protein
MHTTCADLRKQPPGAASGPSANRARNRNVHLMRARASHTLTHKDTHMHSLTQALTHKRKHKHTHTQHTQDIAIYGTNGCDPAKCDADDFLDLARKKIKLNESAARQLQALYADEPALPGE